MKHLSLDFDLLDDLALGAERNQLDVENLGRVDALSFGPFVEVAFLASQWEQKELAQLDWLNKDDFQSLFRDFRFQQTREQLTGVSTGWICGDQLETDEPWTGFLFRVSAACKAGRFGKRSKNAIMATFEEFRSNIQEHAGDNARALSAFHLGPSGLEVIVADQGRGALASIQESPKFRTLNDAGSALELIVQDGVSRFETPGHGHGFSHLFEGLANRFNHIRLRSGDHALEVFRQDGSRPSKIVSQKAQFSGFLVYARFDPEG